MPVTRLDHVNIVCADLLGTAAFYTALLGMRAEPTPTKIAGFQGRWMFNASGDPILHLITHQPDRHTPLDEIAHTGSIDHVALACEGFADIWQRCLDMGLNPRLNDRQFADLRQIFVHDPNGVKLELNFNGD